MWSIAKNPFIFLDISFGKKPNYMRVIFGLNCKVLKLKKNTMSLAEETKYMI